MLLREGRREACKKPEGSARLPTPAHPPFFLEKRKISQDRRHFFEAASGLSRLLRVHSGAVKESIAGIFIFIEGNIYRSLYIYSLFFSHLFLLSQTPFLH